ncbi:reverse transcriptase domain-containing protein [Tanacetum coccineum]
MPPKRTITPMTDATIKKLIALGVADVLAEYEANRSSENGDDSHDSGSGRRRTKHTTHECTYSDFLKCQPLNFKGTEGVELALMCGRMFIEESDQVEKYVGGLPDMIQGIVMASKPKTMQEAVKIANDLIDQKVRAYAERQAENKRKLDNNNQAQQQPPKKQNMARAYSTRPSEKKEYAGTLQLCNKYKFHHNGPCTVKCANCNRVGHLTWDCRSPTATKNKRTLTCYECGNQGYYRSDCPEFVGKIDCNRLNTGSITVKSDRNS